MAEIRAGLERLPMSIYVDVRRLLTAHDALAERVREQAISYGRWIDEVHAILARFDVEELTDVPAFRELLERAPLVENLSPTPAADEAAGEESERDRQLKGYRCIRCGKFCELEEI